MMPKVELDEPAASTPIPTEPAAWPPEPEAAHHQNAKSSETAEPFIPELATKPAKTRGWVRRLIVGALVILALAVVVLGSMWIFHKVFPPPVATNNSSSKLATPSFTTLRPTGAVKLVENSSKYDEKLQILASEVQIPGNSAVIALSQQAVPPNITQPGKAYDAFVAALGKTRAIITPAGKVFLVQPTSGKNSIQAVLIGDPMIVFAKANKPLIDDEWQTLFEGLAKS